MPRKKRDPKTGTVKLAQVKSLKVVEDVYIQMRTQKTQSLLNSQLLQMQELQSQKLKRLKNLLLEKYKY